MMKKQRLLFLMMLLTAASASAKEALVNGLWYELAATTEEAKVIQWKNYVYYSDDIVIPKTFEYGGISYTVTSIGDRAFYDCSDLTSVSIPNSVTTIGGNAFRGCSSLKTITLPNGVTGIAYATFAYCSALTSVTIPGSVTSIGDYAFQYCSSLATVTIPGSVTSIGAGAFWGCGLTSVTIPYGVTTVKECAFLDCSGLTSVTIPGSVTSIDDSAFNGCSSLTSLKIPNSVTSIGHSAFYRCGSLTSVMIGSGVTSIDDFAFANCSDLAHVYCLAEHVPQTANDTFSDSPIGNCTLYVPEASLSAYTEAEPWSSFQSIAAVNGNMFYHLKVTAGDGGSVDYNGQEVTAASTTFVVNEGSDAVLTITPAQGNELAVLTVNGEDVLTLVSNGTLTLNGIEADKTVVATFALEQKEEVTITMSMAGSSCKAMTFSCPYGLDFTNVKGLTAWIASGVSNEGEVLLKNVKIVPPNTGVYLISDEAGLEVVVPTTTKDFWYTNLLRPAVAEATIAPTEMDDGEEYMSFVAGQLTDGEPGFVPVTQNTTLGPSQARLLVPKRYYTALAERQGGLKLNYSILGDMNGDKKLTPADAIMVLYRYFGADTGN